MDLMQAVQQGQVRTDRPAFRPGDTVKVYWQISEGGRQRIQVFEGVVIGRAGAGLGETFTVRKVSQGVGVERVFPLHSPLIDHIEVAREGRVRRAKLYYLRQLTGRAARIGERRQAQQVTPAATGTTGPVTPATTAASQNPEPENHA